MESKTKKKLGTAIGGVAVVGAAVTLTAGTFSYFSDSYNSHTQHVKAGTLKFGKSTVGKLNISNLEPGGKVKSQTFHVYNTGTLDGHLRVGVKQTGGNNYLNHFLRVKVGGHGWHHLGHKSSLGTLRHKEPKDISIKVKMVGNGHDQNAAQGKHVNAKVTADLSQK